MLHRIPSTFLNAKTIVEKDPKTSSVSVTITATAEQTRDAYDRVITDASKVRVRVTTHTHKLYTTYYSHNPPQSLDIPGFRKGSKIPANVVESVLEKGGRGGKEFLKKQGKNNNNNNS